MEVCGCDKERVCVCVRRKKEWECVRVRVSVHSMRKRVKKRQWGKKERVRENRYTLGRLENVKSIEHSCKSVCVGVCMCVSRLVER